MPPPGRNPIAEIRFPLSQETFLSVEPGSRMRPAPILYELREYLVAEGRIQDEIDRARDTILPIKEGGLGLFFKHGIPRPWAIFRCVYGRPLPCMAFIYAWAGATARAQAFPSLYNDPAWTELRLRTNGGHEIVERIDDIVLTGPALPAQPSGNGLFEFCRGANSATDNRLLGPLQPLCGTDLRPLSIYKVDTLPGRLASDQKLFELIEL